MSESLVRVLLYLGKLKSVSFHSEGLYFISISPGMTLDIGSKGILLGNKRAELNSKHNQERERYYVSGTHSECVGQRYDSQIFAVKKSQNEVSLNETVEYEFNVRGSLDDKLTMELTIFYISPRDYISSTKIQGFRIERLRQYFAKVETIILTVPFSRVPILSAISGPGISSIECGMWTGAIMTATVETGTWGSGIGQSGTSTSPASTTARVSSSSMSHAQGESTSYIDSGSGASAHGSKGSKPINDSQQPQSARKSPLQPYQISAKFTSSYTGISIPASISMSLEGAGRSHPAGRVGGRSTRDVVGMIERDPGLLQQIQGGSGSLGKRLISGSLPIDTVPTKGGKKKHESSKKMRNTTISGRELMRLNGAMVFFYFRLCDGLQKAFKSQGKKPSVKDCGVMDVDWDSSDTQGKFASLFDAGERSCSTFVRHYWRKLCEAFTSTCGKHGNSIATGDLLCQYLAERQSMAVDVVQALRTVETPLIASAERLRDFEALAAERRKAMKVDNVGRTLVVLSSLNDWITQVAAETSKELNRELDKMISVGEKLAIVRGAVDAVVEWRALHPSVNRDRRVEIEDSTIIGVSFPKIPVVSEASTHAKTASPKGALIPSMMKLAQSKNVDESEEEQEEEEEREEKEEKRKKRRERDREGGQGASPSTTTTSTTAVTASKTETRENIIIFQHGLGGTADDLAFFEAVMRGRVATAGTARHFHFHAIQANQDKTEDTIDVQAERLLAELRQYLLRFAGKRYVVHFIGHSLGCLVLRRAVEVLGAEIHLGCFICCSAPHLGAGVSTKNKFVKSGLSLLSRMSKGDVLKELRLKRPTLYDMAHKDAESLKRFERIVLFSALGDDFADSMSALILGSLKDDTKGTDLAEKLRELPLTRIIASYPESYVKKMESGLDSLIGRTLHVIPLSDWDVVSQIVDISGILGV